MSAPLAIGAQAASSFVDQANAELEGAEASTIIRWAARTFGDGLVVSSSFGAHSAAMLHLVSRHAPRTPIVLIDTGYLFPETYRFANDLAERFELDLRVYQPRLSAAHHEAIFGRLWEQGEEGVGHYLRTHKVEPMQRALRELGAAAWISGVRGDQTRHRSSLRAVAEQDGRFKVHPILAWSVERVEAYLRDHGLPFHPLHAEGYRSIGDVHSTLPTLPGQDPRDGRLLGSKRECGLHLPLSDEQNRSLTSSKL